MSGNHCLTDTCQFGGTQMSQPVRKLTSKLVAQVQDSIQVKCRKRHARYSMEGNLKERAYERI